MNEHSMRDAYDATLRANDMAGQGDAVPMERLEALVAREGDEEERLRTLDVLMSSAEGRREFEIAWAASRAVPQRSVWRWNARLSAAAALLFVSLGTFGVMRGRPDPLAPLPVAPVAASGTDGGAATPQPAATAVRTPASAQRAPSTAAPERAPALAPARAATREEVRGVESALQLIAPQGRAVPSTNVTFAWHRLDGAGDYTLVLVDNAGREVFASLTRDTVVALPDSVQLRPGGEYLWWVETEGANGSRVTAVTEKVRIRP